MGTQRERGEEPPEREEREAGSERDADSKQAEEDSQDDVQKSYVTILDQEVSAGLHELERPSRGLALSALSAGLDIGFSVFFVGLVETLGPGGLPELVFELLRAGAYAVGFIFVIFGRSELFTEHTALAMLPVLAGRASLAQLGRLWGIVYVFNLVGGALFAALLALVGPALGVVEVDALGRIGRSMVDHPGWVIFLSAVLAGWMMGLVSWLVTAARETISELLFVGLVTAAIGFGHLHHCIVGSAEVLAALFAGAGHGVTWAGFGHFLFWATFGNVVGGVIFVAVIKWGHVRGSRRGMRHPDTWPPSRGGAEG